MISIKTSIPGPRSKYIRRKLSNLNGSKNIVYPFVHGKKGQGCYFTDIDNNTYLDFGSQIAVNPLGYNHPRMLKALRKLQKRFPLKFAGQDFIVEQHLQLLEELISVTPKRFNQGFLINSGAEAVENSLKICLRKQKCAKIGISFEKGWHGRTLGALSCTNSKTVQKKGYFSFNMRRLPFDSTAGAKLQRIIDEDSPAEEIGFVIVEGVQGEGGYNIAPAKMMRDIRKITKKHKIPLICDEVQAGMARTGKWWSYQNFDITPDVQSCAKALQVGAVVSSKDMFPKEQSSISSTYGGGDIISMTLGTETIRTIKEDKLLHNINRIGNYPIEQLKDLEDRHEDIKNVRGLGLMDAFDLPNPGKRDMLILELVKRGVIVLGCGTRAIRVLPPYIAAEKDIDTFTAILDQAMKGLAKKKYKPKISRCSYLGCGHVQV